MNVRHWPPDEARHVFDLDTREGLDHAEKVLLHHLFEAFEHEAPYEAQWISSRCARLLLLPLNLHLAAAAVASTFLLPELCRKVLQCLLEAGKAPLLERGGEGEHGADAAMRRMLLVALVCVWVRKEKERENEKETESERKRERERKRKRERERGRERRTLLFTMALTVPALPAMIRHSNMSCKLLAAARSFSAAS